MWVGLSSTTSAPETAAIMRLRPIASWRDRRIARIIGSPSEFLFSSATSRLVIRVLLRLRRMTTKRSIAARPRPAMIADSMMEATPPVVSAMRWLIGRPPATESTGMRPCSTETSTAPTTTVLTTALTPSHAAWKPNTRLMPATGSNWSNLGVSFLGWIPPCTAVAAMIAITTTTNMGVSAGMTVSSPFRSTRTAASGSGCAMMLRNETTAAAPVSFTPLIVFGIITVPAPTATHDTRSFEVEIWPLARTSFMRFSVAGSVRSCASLTRRPPASS